MEFDWTTEQQQLRKSIIEFARSELADDTVEADQAGVFPRHKWNSCAEFGVQGLYMPEEFSGTPALDLISALYAMEALGYACSDNGLTFALNAQMWTVQLPILHFGSDDQKKRFLPELCAGRHIGVHAVTEELSGSDVYSMQTTAIRGSDGYTLNGRKKYVTCAPIADLALVFASTDKNRGKWGLSVFVVETDREGVSRGDVEGKMGLRTAPFGDLVFENCVIPESNRLGPEGAGMSMSANSLEYERCCIFISQLGAMERQLEKAIEYARTRQQFGRPIGQFQAVSHRLVDMRLRFETARLLLYKTAWLKQMGRPATLESALVKLHLSEAYIESSVDAIRTLGAIGYTQAAETERALRDAVGGVLYAGTSDIQRNIAARLLGIG